MRTCAAFVLIAVLGATSLVAAEPKTPETFLGRWAAVEMHSQGVPVSLDQLQLDIEFTPTQLHLRLSARGEPRMSEPTHVFDCCFATKDGLVMLDLKTASNSPGPETELHTRAIADVAGDTLRICSGHSDDPKTPGERPKDFNATLENKNDLLVLRRVPSNR